MAVRDEGGTGSWAGMGAVGRFLSEPLPQWAEVSLLLLILGIAAAFRLYQIGTVPPGPHYDEASATFDALDVLEGRHTVFSLRPYGREMLFVYVATPLVAWLDPGRLAIRLPAAVIGILSVLATYLLARELFSREDKRKAQWTGLLAALFLAISFWHVTINHLSFRANYLPLTETLCFFFLWRAMRTDRLAAYVASGVFLGLGLHTYIAARFVPVTLVVFFSFLLLTEEGRVLVLSRWRRWLLLAAVALVIFAPLLVFFLTNPDYFILRAGGISIFSPHLNQGDPLGLLLRSTLGNLGLFGFKGDPNWLFNIPGRSPFDPIQALFFWLGVVYCLLLWRKRPYAFLLVWLFVMLLPSILAPDPIPHHLRAIGALPAAGILSALAITGVAPSLFHRSSRLARVAAPVLGVLLLLYLSWAVRNTWRTYYDDWSRRDEVYYAYYGHMADLAAQMNGDDDPEAVFLFPVNRDRNAEDYDEYTVELLYDGSVPYHYITVDDTTVSGELTEFIAGRRNVKLIVWTHGDHVDADPRGVLPFHLERFGHQVEEQVFRGYRILTYELESADTDFGAPLEFVPDQAAFGTGPDVVGHAHASTGRSGDSVWAAVRWRAGAPVERDLKASLRLLDPDGRLIGQSDAWLLTNEHDSTSLWMPGETVTSYYLVSSPPGTMPGPYDLELVLYEAETGAGVPLVDEAGIPLASRLTLGTVQIVRPRRPAEIQPPLPIEPVQLAPGLDLVGYDLERRQVSAGETLPLALYWRAASDITSDHTVILELLDSDEQAVVEWTGAPSYPTSEWQAGDQWVEWWAPTLAPDVEPGTYSLTVRLEGAVPGEGPVAIIDQVVVEGRSRQFDVPSMEVPTEVQFGGGIRLLGYDLGPTEVQAGEVLQLTLYWRAGRNVDESYTVFTHLLDQDSHLWGQRDSLPGGGTIPTTGWVPGEVIADKYEIRVSPDAPSGDYVVEIGMYQAETGRRLPVVDLAGAEIADHVLLDSPIRVVP